MQNYLNSFARFARGLYEYSKVFKITERYKAESAAQSAEIDSSALAVCFLIGQVWS